MAKKITFLGIETSCDETAAAVIRENDKGTADILSNIVSSQIEEHKKFGGVIPEIASRAHLQILQKISIKALEQAKISIKEIDIFTKRPHLDDVQLLIGYDLGSASENIFSHMKGGKRFLKAIFGFNSIYYSINHDKTNNMNRYQ